MNKPKNKSLRFISLCVIAVLLAICLATVLVACGDNTNSENNNSTGNNNSNNTTPGGNVTPGPGNDSDGDTDDVVDIASSLIGFILSSTAPDREIYAEFFADSSRAEDIGGTGCVGFFSAMAYDDEAGAAADDENEAESRISLFIYGFLYDTEEHAAANIETVKDSADMENPVIHQEGNYLIAEMEDGMFDKLLQYKIPSDVLSQKAVNILKANFSVSLPEGCATYGCGITKHASGGFELQKNSVSATDGCLTQIKYYSDKNSVDSNISSEADKISSVYTDDSEFTIDGDEAFIILIGKEPVSNDDNDDDKNISATTIFESLLGYALSNATADKSIYISGAFHNKNGYSYEELSKPYGDNCLGYYAVNEVIEGDSTGYDPNFCYAIIYDSKTNAAANLESVEEAFVSALGLDGLNVYLFNNLIILETAEGYYSSTQNDEIPENSISDNALEKIMFYISSALSGDADKANTYFYKSINYTYFESISIPIIGNCKTTFEYLSDPSRVDDSILAQIDKLGTYYTSDSFATTEDDGMYIYLKEKAQMLFEENEDGDGYLLVSYRFDTEEGCNLVIPEEYNGKPVIGITLGGNSTYCEQSRLTSIIIPDSVTIIGNGAFAYCTNITSITIPDGVTSIGNYAFSDCYMLTSIIIPISVTTMGFNVFSGCSNLETIYCEAESKPDGWSTDWFTSPWGDMEVEVVWGYQPEQE